MAQIDFNALGQAFDTTWGRTSTPKTAGYSVKFDMNGADLLTAKYAAVVSFAHEREMIEMRRRYDEESDRVIDAVVKAVKNRYKSLTGSAIKLKKVDDSEANRVEVISMNHHNLKRTAYYRKCVQFEMG
jgi:hypothetical protein